MKDFIEYIRNTKGYSSATAVAYEKDLTAAATWAQKHGATLETATSAIWQTYAEAMGEQGRTPATVKRRISTLRTYYRWAIHTRKRKDNPARFVETPKKGRSIPHTVEEETINQAIEQSDLETAALIATAYSTGLRVSELVKIETSDRVKNARAIRVTGKGRAERIVYYDQRTADLLNAYLGTRRGLVFTMDESKARAAITAAFAFVGEKASPHTLRHSMATKCISKGMDVETLRLLLGHKRTETTANYLNMATETTYKKYKQIWE